MTKKLTEQQRKSLIKDIEVEDELEYRKQENPIKHSSQLEHCFGVTE